ncbi:hypothetical protein HNQ36_001058 [Afipia massiliensis]|uniref:Uncharacterized protein n=1 Tax=Afipia massiliensis TaxID=211460 RepID=A0A840MXG4_9BRAD|nr:hypothetical protein [Afipia massiliensis]MBB5051104.1 hypothetical protein [Afipia massiliensis]
MSEKPFQKFKENRPYSNPEAAARELLRIYRAVLKDGGTHTYTGITNREFIYDAGGSVEEYAAGRDFGIAQKWFRIDESGTRVFLLPDGEDA